MPGETFIIRIESLAYGGQGVGRRDDGKVVFSPLVIPGEVVRVHCVSEHPSYCVAQPEEILQAAPSRTTPSCAIFNACGGCDWQHIAYSEQLTFKNNILSQAFRRFIPDITSVLDAPLPAPTVYAYRCHARLHYRQTPSTMLGFYQKRTHSVLACQQCPVLNTSAQGALSQLNDTIRHTPLPGITAIEIYAPQDEVLLLAHTTASRPSQVSHVLSHAAGQMGVSGCHLVNDKTYSLHRIMGQEHFSYRIETPARTFELSGHLGGFIQANLAMNDHMVRHVMDLTHNAGQILDLYGGCGNFGIPLALTARRVVVVERDRRLIALGSRNAEHNQVSNISFIPGDVRKSLPTLRLGGFDTIVLDPPREGAKSIIPLLSELKPARIIYVSCNPMTLARDVHMLMNGGFRLISLKLFDMFPQTYHVESVALLEPA